MKFHLDFDVGGKGWVGGSEQRCHLHDLTGKTLSVLSCLLHTFCTSVTEMSSDEK